MTTNSDQPENDPLSLRLDPIVKRERARGKGPSRYESVEADPGVQDKRLLVYEPEYANVLKQTEGQGNTLSAILRQAWDGIDLRTLTKNSPVRSTAARTAMSVAVFGSPPRRRFRPCYDI